MTTKVHYAVYETSTGAIVSYGMALPERLPKRVEGRPGLSVVELPGPVDPEAERIDGGVSVPRPTNSASADVTSGAAPLLVTLLDVPSGSTLKVYDSGGSVVASSREEEDVSFSFAHSGTYTIAIRSPAHLPGSIEVVVA